MTVVFLDSLFPLLLPSSGYQSDCYITLQSVFTASVSLISTVTSRARPLLAALGQSFPLAGPRMRSRGPRRALRVPGPGTPFPWGLSNWIPPFFQVSLQSFLPERPCITTVPPGSTRSPRCHAPFCACALLLVPRRFWRAVRGRQPRIPSVWRWMAERVPSGRFPR